MLAIMKNDTQIYKKLKQLRKERGLTLATLADKIGSDYQQLSRIERGKSRLTVDVLMKMANVFDTSIDQLVSGQVSEEPKKTTVEGASGICQDKLGEILEKLDVVLQQKKIAVSAQDKAMLASLIYKEALKNSSAVDFAVSIISTLLHV